MGKKKTRKASKAVKNLSVKTTSVRSVKGGGLKKLPGKRTPPTVVLGWGGPSSAE